MTLSLAMIVRNEAACLRRCLDSVAGLVDEMVVVDTGSDDDTVAIARSCGARVEHFPWTGHFGDARNAALAHCTGDWVLQLDADEALDAGWHEGVRELIRDHPTVWCWCLRIVNMIDEQPLQHDVSRLFRRLPDWPRSPFLAASSRRPRAPLSRPTRALPCRFSGQAARRALRRFCGHSGDRRAPCRFVGHAADRRAARRFGRGAGGRRAPGRTACRLGRESAAGRARPARRGACVRRGPRLRRQDAAGPRPPRGCRRGTARCRGLDRLPAAREADVPGTLLVRVARGRPSCRLMCLR